MRARGKNMTKLNKIIPFQAQTLQKKQFLTESIDTSPSIQDSYASFDRFVYRDHVTLKNYPLDQLRRNEIFTRQSTQVNNFFNFDFEGQNPKTLESLDLWKKIQENRNKMLVDGNRGKYKQLWQKRQKLPNREFFLEQSTKDEEFRFEIMKSKTTQNPLIPDSFSIPESNRSISQQKFKLKDNLGQQSMIKFKRKLNNQLYKINKQIFRDYLQQKSNEFIDFNILANDSDKFQQKVKKLKKLMQTLEIKNEKINLKSLIQLTHTNQVQHKKNSFKNSNEPKIIEKAFKTHKIRSKTQFGDSEGIISCKRQVSLQRFNKNSLHKRVEKSQNQEKKKLNTISSCWRYKNLSPSEIQQLTKNIEEYFTKSCQKIDEQIKMKFRREVRYSISPKKVKQKHFSS